MTDSTQATCQYNTLPLSQQGNYNARQDPQNNKTTNMQNMSWSNQSQGHTKNSQYRNHRLRTGFIKAYQGRAICGLIDFTGTKFSH